MPWALVDSECETTRSLPAISALEAVLSHGGRIVLSVGDADLGVHHVGPLEERGVGRPRHQGGDRHPGVLQLGAQASANDCTNDFEAL